MEMGDILGLDGFVLGNWEEDLFPKKTSSLTSAAQPAMELNERYSSAAKTNSGHFSRSASLLAAGGEWSISTNGEKDPEGNSKATVEGSIQIETDNGDKWSTNGGGSISSDKNQNIGMEAYGSSSFKVDTDHDFSYTIGVEGKISNDGKNSVRIEGRIDGKF